MDCPNDPETFNLAMKNKPTHTEDSKNTKADPTTETRKNNRTAPMLKLITSKNDLQETPDDTPPLGAISPECRHKYTTKVGPNKPSRDFYTDMPNQRRTNQKNASMQQHEPGAKKTTASGKTNKNLHKAERTKPIVNALPKADPPE